MDTDPPPNPLIQPHDLSRSLRDLGAVMFEMSHEMVRSDTAPFELKDLSQGSDLCRKVHILNDMSALDSSLPFTSAGPKAISRRLMELGASPDKPVICVTRGKPYWAARLWWQCRYAGFSKALVLNGNVAEIDATDFVDLREETKRHAAKLTVPERNDLIYATKAEVIDAIDSPQTILLNALPYRKFTGDSSTHLSRRGRIPGSKNLASELLYDERGQMVAVSKLRSFLTRCDIDPDGDQRVIAYCGGGLAASSTCLALERVGHRNWALYDGSLDEWSRDPLLPIETGPVTQSAQPV